jgi:hypothetical protein
MASQILAWHDKKFEREQINAAKKYRHGTKYYVFICYCFFTVKHKSDEKHRNMEFQYLKGF